MATQLVAVTASPNVAPVLARRHVPGHGGRRPATGLVTPAAPELVAQRGPTRAERVAARLAAQKKAKLDRIQDAADVVRAKLDAKQTAKLDKEQAKLEFHQQKITDAARLKAERAAFRNTHGSTLADLFTAGTGGDTAGPVVVQVPTDGAASYVGGGTSGGPVEYDAEPARPELAAPGPAVRPAASSFGPKTKIGLAVGAGALVLGWMGWRYVTKPVRYVGKLWNAGTGVAAAVKSFHSATKG